MGGPGVPGTGPARGIPWWRWRRPLTSRRDHGWPPMVGVTRPGRVIHMIKREAAR